MTEQVIGVDLGGTNIKLGRYTREGECLNRSQNCNTPTSIPRSCDRRNRSGDS